MSEEVLAALKEAILNEQDGYKFYMEMVAKVQDEQGKGLFESLARDEKEHLRILQVEYGAVSGDGQWFDLESMAGKRAPDSVLVLFPSDAAAGLELAPDAGDLDVLQVGMDFERRGYQMYSKAAAETDNPDARAVFNWLAKEENKHYAILSKAYDYLESDGLWYFQEEERPMFEG